MNELATLTIMLDETQAYLTPHPDTPGDTLLYLAASRGDLSTVEWIVGAQNTLGDNPTSASHSAIYTEERLTLKQCIKENHGFTPFDS